VRALNEDLDFVSIQGYPMPQFTFTVVAFILAFATCHGFASDADDAKKLQGTWELTELIAFGEKVDFNTVKGTKFVFAADKLTLQAPNDKLEEVVTRTYSFKLDPTKKPAEVDLTVLTGEHKGLKSPGIYEISGDTLRWCQSDAPKGAERPKDFKSPEKSTIYLFTFKRAGKPK
jgi:uncharacterized protein (TIGR03067 family)